jgi:ribose 5-phosphate isomerase B
MIALGSDHAGLSLKREIMAYLNSLGVEFKDYGTFDDTRCDYPHYALLASHSVADGTCEKGILCCGTGIGISIAANKVPGIRCVVCSDSYSAILSRNHNDTNMLALGSRVVGTDLALLIVQNWLSAQYEGGRHARRIEQIAGIEKMG